MACWRGRKGRGGAKTPLPHGVRQRQDAQSKEVERQQQVDVLLRKHLQADASVSDGTGSVPKVAPAGVS